jgi:hypothetical protein
MIDTPNMERRHAGRLSHIPSLSMNFSHDIISEYLKDDACFPQHGPPVSLIVNDGAANGESLNKCRLCNVRGLTTKKLEIHCEGELHDRNVHDLYNDLSKVQTAAHRALRLLCEPLCDDIAQLDQISYLAWKREIHAELYEFMMAPQHPSYNGEMKLIERTTKKLATYVAK